MADHDYGPKLPRRYDGNLPGSWSECPWMPKHIRDQHTVRQIELLNALASALLAQGATTSDFDTFEGKPITDEQRRQLRIRGYR